MRDTVRLKAGKRPHRLERTLPGLANGDFRRSVRRLSGFGFHGLVNIKDRTVSLAPGRGQESGR